VHVVITENDTRWPGFKLPDLSNSGCEHTHTHRRARKQHTTTCLHAHFLFEGWQVVCISHITTDLLAALVRIPSHARKMEPKTICTKQLFPTTICFLRWMLECLIFGGGLAVEPRIFVLCAWFWGPVPRSSRNPEQRSGINLLLCLQCTSLSATQKKRACKHILQQCCCV
jgi:hypothetical protein